MKKIVCKVCKTKFRATRETRYTVKSKAEMLATTRQIECFDCPTCGCQNTVNVRLPQEEPGNG